MTYSRRGDIYPIHLAMNQGDHEGRPYVFPVNSQPSFDNSYRIKILFRYNFVISKTV